jgi:hypothetical protein
MSGIDVGLAFLRGDGSVRGVGSGDDDDRESAESFSVLQGGRLRLSRVTLEND